MTSKDTTIEWTEKTWQVTRGCSRESPGCEGCYAEGIARRFREKAFAGYINKHGKWNGNLTLLHGSLADPLRWRKPAKVFVNSMSDLFHESVPDDYIAAVFAVMAACPQHTFQVLTKRAARMRRWFEGMTHRPRMQMAQALNHWMGPRYMTRIADVWPLPNVWLGVSVEDQKRADERLPELQRCPAAVRWVSFEPLIDPVAVKDWTGISWAVVGGESGPAARPMMLSWARRLLADGQRAGVAMFMKQLGRYPDGYPKWLDEKTGKATAYGHGGDMEVWPEDMRVRMYPGAAA